MVNVARQVEARSPSSGVNQQGVRDHNERLLLSMMQRLGPHAGSDLAKMANLSPQTVSVILRGLENDGLLARGEPQRGKVGKPSIPMGLAADGVLSIGLKIGRRSADLVLMDFLGNLRSQFQTTYRYPMPETVFGFLRAGIASFQASLSRAQVNRIAGIGIAKPFEIWNWSETIGAPAEDLDQWRDINFAEQIGQFSALPVFVENDATAACRAEHIFGKGREFRDFAYFFVGSFIGGGVVLNHSVFEGIHGNAGAFGSLPTRLADGRNGQLLDSASLFLLEAALADVGLEPSRLWAQPQDWTGFPDQLEAWIEQAAQSLAYAALTICAVIDFEAIVIDGAFPTIVRDRLVRRTQEAVSVLDSRGLALPHIIGGKTGGNARAIGAASGPVFSQYLLNTHAGLASA